MHHHTSVNDSYCINTVRPRFFVNEDNYFDRDRCGHDARQDSRGDKARVRQGEQCVSARAYTGTMMSPFYDDINADKRRKGQRSRFQLMIQREEGDRLIILLSDGYSFDLSNGEDERLARTFRDDRITVHAVHIGPGSPPDPLVNMTARTGGEVFAAGDPEGLKGHKAPLQGALVPAKPPGRKDPPWGGEGQSSPLFTASVSL